MKLTHQINIQTDIIRMDEFLIDNIYTRPKKFCKFGYISGFRKYVINFL